MTTLRKGLERKIEQATDAIKVYQWVDENHPALLDLEVNFIYAYGFGHIELVGARGEKGLAAKVASILGIEKSIVKDVDETREEVRFPISADESYGFTWGSVTVVVRVPLNGCKRYRVVEEKILEVCGDVDESKYLEVEELD
jgi:hypothetical protein